jgi:DNA-binding transcriptional LysR family regulator
MDKFAALKTFLLVADEGGFSRAATELGLSKSVASRQISALETALGTRLLHRTTRRVGLTEAGQAYHDHARSILAELKTAEKALLAAPGELSGFFRIAAPTAFGASRLAPVLAAFMARHPRLTAEATLTDRVVDLGEEGFDLALRIVGPDRDSASPQRLAAIETGLYAAPEYLARKGRPQAPGDLIQHAGLALGERTQAWSLRGTTEPVAIEIRLASNNASVVREAALAALGIAMLPSFIVSDDAKQGRLLRLLDGFEAKPAALCAEYPAGRVPPARTRLFVEFLVAALRRDGV